MKLCCRVSWRLNRIRLIAAMYMSSADLHFISTTQEFSMVGGYTEDLKKKCQNREVGAYTGMAAFPGQCIVKMQIHTEGIRQHKRGLTKLPQK